MINRSLKLLILAFQALQVWEHVSFLPFSRVGMYQHLTDFLRAFRPIVSVRIAFKTVFVLIDRVETELCRSVVIIDCL